RCAEPDRGGGDLLDGMTLHSATADAEISPEPPEVEAERSQEGDGTSTASLNAGGERRAIERGQCDGERDPADRERPAHHEQTETEAGPEQHADDHDGLRATKRSGASIRAIRSMPTSETANSAPMPSSTAWPAGRSYGSRYDRENTSNPPAKS